MQRRDVELLLKGDDLDWDYLRSWALHLGVDTVLNELWR
jgi:hypothetical protein